MTEYQQTTDQWQPDTSRDAPRRLRRSRTDRVLAGVCGGVGRYLNIDPVVLRIITIALIFRRRRRRDLHHRLARHPRGRRG